MIVRSSVFTGSRIDGRGQILVLFALGLVAMIAAVALIVEGANAFAQQRIAQNGSDGASNAGAVILAEYWSGALRTGDQVAIAVNDAADANGIEVASAEYTDGFGDPIGVAIDLAGATTAEPIPASAQGVAVAGTRTFDTAFARVIGIPSLGATADATTVVGVLSTACVAEEDGCALLPVTFPVGSYLCDERGDLDPDSVPWGVGYDPDDPTSPYWDIVEADDLPGSTTHPNGNPETLAVLSLCRSSGDAAGAFGWLDLDPEISNLAGEIEGPLNVEFYLPDWFQTQPGTPNSVEDELLKYIHEPVLLPLYDAVCIEEPVDSDPSDPDNDGICDPGKNKVDPTGNNTWYHIPTMVVFYLNEVYVRGSNIDECTSPPGEPLQTDVIGGGFLGCLKGWFVNYVIGGPIVPGQLPERGIDPIGIQMIR